MEQRVSKDLFDFHHDPSLPSPLLLILNPDTSGLDNRDTRVRQIWGVDYSVQESGSLLL